MEGLGAHEGKCAHESHNAALPSPCEYGKIREGLKSPFVCKPFNNENIKN